MFKTLLVKEWKEKAPVAALGLGLMALFTAVFLIVGDDRDLAEFIPATFLIVFFPFLGLMLGAGAFESEFRNGSWAFLFSRPVRKETIWLAKLTALLSILAAFWGAFAGLMAVLPGLDETVQGYKILELLDFGIEVLPLVLISSFFYFSIAFSLSVLSERQLNLVFGSLFLGFALQGLLALAGFWAAGRDYLSARGNSIWLDAYLLALVLSALAFLGASFITFRKADFSQPKRKALSLAKYAAAFLAAAWLVSAAWPVLRLGPEQTGPSDIKVTGGEAFFGTSKGIYRCEIASGKVSRIAGGRFFESVFFSVAGGKVLYGCFSRNEEFSLRIMNTDGSDKKHLLPNGKDDPIGLEWAYGFDLSPDGGTWVLFCHENEGPRGSRTHRRTAWSGRADGSGFTRLPPFDPALAGNGNRSVPIHYLGWTASPDSLLLWALNDVSLNSSLWTYNIKTGAQACLLEGRRVRSSPISPGGDSVLASDQPEIDGPKEIFLLDTMSGERTPVTTIEFPGDIYFGVINSRWSRTGDRIAFLVCEKRGVYSVSIYSRGEGRLIEAKGFPPGGPLPQEPSYLSPSIDWILGDSKLVLGVPKERRVKVLGPDLAVEKTLPVPPGVGKDFHVRGANEAVLVTDFSNDAIWRLDLETEKWKKIW